VWELLNAPWSGWVASGLLLAVAAPILALLSRRVTRLQDEVTALRGKQLDERVEVRRLRKLEDLQDDLLDLLVRLPGLSRELFTSVKLRELPEIVQRIVQRTFEPSQVVVAIRRQPSPVDPRRDDRLVVAAAASSSAPPPLGTEIPVGEGEIGFVAEVQRTLDRGDLSSLPPMERAQIERGSQGLAGFDVIAPMVVERRTLGVIAFAAPPNHRGYHKAVLTLIAQMAAHKLQALADLKKVQSTASTDGLTGVLNKRTLLLRLGEAILEAEDRRDPVTVFLFDLDHFKHYNDRNGHLAGDQLLRQLAGLVTQVTRRDDLFGRFGGEEFLLILPGRSMAEGQIAAANVRRAIAAFGFLHAEAQPLGKVSISGGLATFPNHGRNSTDILAETDAALYAAKRAGRDRVYSPEEAAALSAATMASEDGEVSQREPQDGAAGRPDEAVPGWGREREAEELFAGDAAEVSADDEGERAGADGTEADPGDPDGNGAPRENGR
jgi:diguanylate cyclase (GGDEF)-like protein